MRAFIYFILMFIWIMSIKVNAQTSVIHKDVWHRYNIDSTGLSLELPSKPRKVDLSDLPLWFHSQSGDRFGFVVKTPQLNIVISTWKFTSFFEADIAMRGIQSGAAFIKSKMNISTGYDEKNDGLIINSVGNIGPDYNIKRFSKSIIVGTRSWLVEVDCANADSSTVKQANNILDSIKLTVSQKNK